MEFNFYESKLGFEWAGLKERTIKKQIKSTIAHRRWLIGDKGAHKHFECLAKQTSAINHRSHELRATEKIAVGHWVLESFSSFSRRLVLAWLVFIKRKIEKVRTKIGDLLFVRVEQNVIINYLQSEESPLEHEQLLVDQFPNAALPSP